MDIKDAVETLKNYCCNVDCEDCKIKYAIRCDICDGPSLLCIWDENNIEE